MIKSYVCMSMVQPYGKHTRQIQQWILWPTNTTFKYFIIVYIKNFITLVKPDLGLIRHTQSFIVLFNIVRPEDGHPRRPKHVGVISKQRT
jgi:hypothetical protein